MNEQSSKKILFNKSTLLSLKAELLKKKDEVHEKKRLPQNKIENFKPPPSKSNEQVDRNRDKANTSFKDRLKVVDVEELEACRKAKAALEKKAELYEHLTDQSGSSQLAGRFLVDFNTKKQQESIKESSSQPEESENRVESDNNDDDEEWVEFTDCLGRTRKCHKSDIDLYIMRDKQLLHAISKDQKVEDVEEPKAPEKPFLVQKTNDYLQSLREKWEEKEQKLLSKDQDIHYQDLLFDEARMHGVAYYSFSTEEKERRKQMKELTRLRQQTLQAQAEAETKRLQQEEMMAARVAAARARRRERAGLPPEDPEESKKKYANLLLDFLNKQKNEADAKAKEEERKLKEEEEKERQKLRDAYIRDWDVGKEGVHDKIKKFKEMTQEEYVEQQRSKRIDEFAPPQSSSNQKTSCSFNSQGKIVSVEPKTLTWGDVRPRPKTPPPPTISEDIEPKGLYFTTKKKDMKYKNFVKSQEPTAIVNELSDSEEEATSSSKGKKRDIDYGGTEIAPPPTYDYYGPVPKKSRPQVPFHSDIREAYAQGAKSLESRPTNNKLSKDYDFSLE